LGRSGSEHGHSLQYALAFVLGSGIPLPEIESAEENKYSFNFQRGLLQDSDHFGREEFVDKIN